MPAFYTNLARKNTRILHNNCPKNIFPNLGGGHVPLLSVSHAYVRVVFDWSIPQVGQVDTFDLSFLKAEHVTQYLVYMQLIF